MLLSFAVAIGAVIQGSIGFGYALVAVPALVLLLPWSVPVTPLLLALPMTVLMSASEWHSIDFGGFFLITAGRLLGTIAGVALLAFVPGGALSKLTGILILAVALESFLKPSIEVRNSTRLSGGIASGVVGTVAALGGTPLALVYQDRSGAELRSTLSISFVVGIAMSLVGLGLAGKVEWQNFALALKLLPGLLVGLLASRWVVKRLDERWLRPAVLTFAAVAGVIIILLGPGGQSSRDRFSARKMHGRNSPEQYLPSCGAVAGGDPLCYPDDPAAQAETCEGFVIQQPERTAQGGALRQTKVRLLGRAGRPDNT